ncbi:30S ribosomal protein S7 [Frankliniella fusca]|uniref:30S ribosomal protein S7 n=1 Tax=Frankliniella fusca TaxID=407009 RepID=A0AAE1LAU7_9NEOP|nr:30S ribosomal protein S7 [Frankliniella fusca]
MVHCPDKRHSLRIRNVTTIMDRLGGDLLDVDFDLTETAAKLSSIKVTVQRCTGGVHLCENMNTWSWATGLCDIMMVKHMAWSHIVENAKPPIECPLKTGSYTMYNISLDLDIVAKAMPGANIEKHVWLSECNTFDENKDLYACFKWVTEARRVRVQEDALHLG